MAFDYYCIRCGQRLNQKIVLFDMQYLLAGEKERNLNILKFRLSKDELEALVKKAQANENGYTECILSFSSIVKTICNRNNLDNPAVSGLTLDDIDAFIKWQRSLNLKSPVSQTSDSDFLFVDPEEEQGSEEEPSDESETPYEIPESISALLEMDTANVDRITTERNLANELETLRKPFHSGDTTSFWIKLSFDLDNTNEKILSGYEFQLSKGGPVVAITNARVCKYCGESVFEHAGTALHQSIAFIGYQSAGKTSTIVALTHYALNHMSRDLSESGDPSSVLWKEAGARPIKNIASVELLSPSPALSADLDLFLKGIAPEKTRASKRDDAYSATFRIKNKFEDKHYLITLTDLPGELCMEDGTIRIEDVINKFPVATSCDAFISCFDTRSINPKGTGITTWISNVCKWTEQFQHLRAVKNNVDTFVPTMLLFTKCQDLESGESEKPTLRRGLPIDEMYCLKDEKNIISQNSVYQFVCEQFTGFGRLNNAYHAMMRLSPFGYPAPPLSEVKKGAMAKTPTPHRIDRLMEWLLCVAGCVPMAAEYKRNAKAVPVIVENYCINRPQIRKENPGGADQFKEAMIRCTMFENPGRLDKRVVISYGDWVQQLLTNMDLKAHPNGNAD